MVDDIAQFIESYGRPCDHAETLGCDSVEVPQIQFIAGSSSQQMGTRLSAVAVMAAMNGGFSAFVGHFSRSSGLSRG